MEKSEFFEKNIFLDLENLNEAFETDSIWYFSEPDFEIVLGRIEQFGIGIYSMNTRSDGASYEVKINEDYRKKATDPKWYKQAFLEFKRKEATLQYSATYKVSDKLLNR
jgi:hypothetical protein